MLFEPLGLSGAYLVKLEKHEDERGSFARSFCKREFQKQGLADEYVQCNISFNKSKRTLRGMHYPLPPHEEVKLVRCSRGAIFDVIVDIKPDSPSFRKWFSCELNEHNNHMLYVPCGFAHGFLTLSDNTEVQYMMSHYFIPQASRTLSYRDPAIGINWPDSPLYISETDKTAKPLSLSGLS